MSLYDLKFARQVTKNGASGKCPFTSTYVDCQAYGRHYVVLDLMEIQAWLERCGGMFRGLNFEEK